jgi:hypothetical protein
VHALNRQITEDFAPIWGCARTLLLQTVDFDPYDPETLTEEPVHGSGVVYILDEATLYAVLGFHDLNGRHLPVTFVFAPDPSDWSVTLSHEILELMIDPDATLFVPGPDPRHQSGHVLHAYEVCDPVERISYQINGVEVSDFVTPRYFNVGASHKRSCDFLGVDVESFGVTRGGRVSFIDESASLETILGTTVSTVRFPPPGRKVRERGMLQRPSDRVLQEYLNGYRKELPGELQPGLPQLRGISRTARYGEAARLIGNWSPTYQPPRAVPARSSQGQEAPQRQVVRSTRGSLDAGQ